MSVNYIDGLAGDIGVLVPGCPDGLLRLYALLALTRGTAVTLEDVHDAWSAWRSETLPEHPALIPFAELSPEVQALDAPYAEAIRQAAAERGPADGGTARWSLTRLELITALRSAGLGDDPADLDDLAGEITALLPGDGCDPVAALQGVAGSVKDRLPHLHDLLVSMSRLVASELGKLEKAGEQE